MQLLYKMGVKTFLSLSVLSVVLIISIGLKFHNQHRSLVASDAFPVVVQHAHDQAATPIVPKVSTIHTAINAQIASNNGTMQPQAEGWSPAWYYLFYIAAFCLTLLWEKD